MGTQKEMKWTLLLQRTIFMTTQKITLNVFDRVL